jgi:hypothetical protein
LFGDILGKGATSSSSVCPGAARLDCCALAGEDEKGAEILENHDPQRCGGVPFGPGLFFSSAETLLAAPCGRWGIALAPGGVAPRGGEGGGDIGAPLLLVLLGVLVSRGNPFAESSLGRDEDIGFALCLATLSGSTTFGQSGGVLGERFPAHRHKK